MSTALATTIHTAALPSNLRGEVRKWYNRTILSADGSKESTMAIAKLHASAAVEGVRATGEGAVFGGILGAVHAMSPTGLDVKIPGTSQKVPVDLVGALLGIVGGTVAAQEPYGLGKTLTNGGAACAAIYGFRQVNDLVAKMKLAKSGVTPGGGASVSGNVTISKASFGAEGSADSGWAEDSRAAFGEDPIVSAARKLG